MWLTSSDTIRVDRAKAAASRCPCPARAQNSDPKRMKSETRSTTESRKAPARRGHTAIEDVEQPGKHEQQPGDEEAPRCEQPSDDRVRQQGESGELPWSKPGPIQTGQGNAVWPLEDGSEQGTDRAFVATRSGKIPDLGRIAMTPVAPLGPSHPPAGRHAGKSVRLEAPANRGLLPF